MNKYDLDKIEDLRKKAEGLIQIIGGTFKGTEAEKNEILMPNIIEPELSRPTLGEIYRLSRL